MKKETTGQLSANGLGRITRREFTAGAAAIGLGAAFFGGAGKALAAMAPPPEGAIATVPVLTINDPADFRILQITDIHWSFMQRGFFVEPHKTAAIQAMVNKFKPDIIVNTGDFWGNVDGKDNMDTVTWSCREFAKFKIPWAFAWGNHDEALDYNLAHKTMEQAPDCVYCGAEDGNYRIEVRAKDGDAPIWNFILLNDSRGGFKPEQIDWFNAEVEKIKKQTPAPPPAFLFFHIPVPQYEDIAVPGNAVGVKFESVCHENGSRDAFPAFRDAGFVKAMFCGHDHVNDYYGYLDGIRLQYGRALGGYGADKVRKGGTLISVDTVKGTFDTKSVFGDGSSVVFDKFITVLEPGRIY